MGPARSVDAENITYKKGSSHMLTQASLLLPGQEYPTPQ